MDLCSNCGQEIVGESIEWNDHTFCSQDCLESFDEDSFEMAESDYYEEEEE